MPRNDQIVRILTVARALAASRTGVGLKTLAERHGWPWRTVYRDVASLERAGLPVAIEKGRYRLLPSWTGPTRAGFDRDELLALFTVRALAIGWRPTTLGRALDRLWHKLSATGDGQSALLPAAQPWLSVRSPIAIDFRLHERTIATFERALRDHLVVNCRYRAVSTRQVTARFLEPGELYWDPGLESLYLIAWCRLRQSVRVFAVQRFLMASVTEETFLPRSEARSKTALRNAFRVWRSENVETVRVRFSPSVADEIRERTWAKGQTIEEEAGGGLALTMPVAGLAEVERWVLGWGPDAEVIAPRTLAERIAARVREAFRRIERRRGNLVVPG